MGLLFPLVLFVFTIQAGASGSARCMLPAGQGYGSLMGSWESLPVKVVVDRQFYTRQNGRLAEALLKAIKTWNEWAEARGKKAFVITGEAEIPLVAGCNQSEYTKEFPEAAGIWIIDGSPGRENRRAECGSDEKILPGEVAQTDWQIEGSRILGASVLLNLEEINAPSGALFDFETVIAHELGHVLGLLHSCNGRGPKGTDGTSAPLCRHSPAAFRKALMAPVFPGDIRRELSLNDLQRLDCLY